MDDLDPSSRQVPLIVRLAGLSAEVMDSFGSSACLEQATAISCLGEELATVRECLVDELYEKIHGAPSSTRHALLEIKRDCYNQRPLVSRIGSEEWQIFEQAMPEAARRLLSLEEKIERRKAAFEESYRREHERERRHLVGLFDDKNLRQGLSLSSPPLVANLRRLLKPVEAFNRKERRLEESLLRYVSRTALKLSPFSTLTRVGLGRVVDQDDGVPMRLELSDVEHRELRRLKKHVILKYFTLLKLHPPVRSRLRVELNSTLQKVGSVRYRFVQPFHWRLNREAREFRFFEEAWISANLRGPLIEALQVVLQQGCSYEQVMERVCHHLDQEPASVALIADKLIDIGFLELLAPWATNDFDPERAFLEFLGTISGDSLVERFRRHLGQLLDLRDVAAPVEDWLRVYRDLEKRRLAGFQMLTEGLGLPAVQEQQVDRQLHEDVFLWRCADAPQDAVARISRSSVERALDSVRPLMLYSDLNYTRYEFLHTLAALAEKHWPGQPEVNLLDVFHVAQPLWQDYVKAATAAITQWQQELWNPFELESIIELQELRDRVHRDMTRCMRREDDELIMDLEAARAAVAQIPDPYVSAFGPCLFAQPVDPEGERWVVNHMLDGTGRFSNRYTTVMPPDLAAHYSACLARGGSKVELYGEPAEMIEILCARDDHLNVHRIHTERVIEMPGEHPHLPSERRLGLQDLRVRLDGPLPYLVDRSERRLVPIFLGTNGLVGMSILVRFLSQLGIGECRLMHPPRVPEQQEDVQAFCRLRIGNLFLRRKLWRVSPVSQLREHLAAASEEDFFLAVDRWRRAHGIPTRLFVAERLQVEFQLWPRHKPQYVDFTSPSFLRVFRSVLETAKDELKFEEMLPMPEAFPADQTGRLWACEAQLESIALQEFVPWKSRDNLPRVAEDQLQSVEA